MPDVLTGEEEIEVNETIQAFKNAIARLNPQDPVEALQITALQTRIDLLSETIEDEVPTPLLCTCNPPTNLKCEYGHPLGPDGYCLNGPQYIPLGAN